MIMPEAIVEPAISLSDSYFDLKGLASYSSLKVPTLRDHIRSGSLPCFKIKGKILVKRSEFDDWVEKYRLNQKRDINTIVNDVMDSLTG